MKIMAAKCSNTNTGMKNTQFRESLPDNTYQFIYNLGTVKAEKAVNTR